MHATNPDRTSVGLAEIFRPEAIIVGLTNRTKPGAIAELVHSLVALGRLGQDAEQTVAASVLTREKLGTTALGNGIAFPHCRTSCTEKFVGALGLEPRGIPFDAVDGEPVFSIFLLLAPLEGREQYFDVLGRIAAVGRDKSQRFQLRGLRTAEQAHHFLQEMDRR